MSTPELREHRVPCLRERLKEVPHRNLRLYPKDPDPYPDFLIRDIGADTVEFEKLSSGQRLPVELRKIAEVTFSSQEERTYIRVLGRVTWDERIKEWRFVPSRIGRPMTKQI
jgi:hypothetical protein